MRLALIMILCLATPSCVSFLTSKPLPKFTIDDIESVELIKIDHPKFQKPLAKFHLPAGRIPIFLTYYESLKSQGLGKFYHEYILSVHLKSGQIHQFKTDGVSIASLKNDYTFKFRDDRLLADLWGIKPSPEDSKPPRPPAEVH